MTQHPATPRSASSWSRHTSSSDATGEVFGWLQWQGLAGASCAGCSRSDRAFFLFGARWRAERPAALYGTEDSVSHAPPGGPCSVVAPADQVSLEGEYALQDIERSQDSRLAALAGC